MGDHTVHAEQIHNFYTLMFSLEVSFEGVLASKSVFWEPELLSCLGSARHTHVELEYCGRGDERAQQGWTRILATNQVRHWRAKISWTSYLLWDWNQGGVELEPVGLSWEWLGHFRLPRLWGKLPISVSAPRRTIWRWNGCRTGGGPQPPLWFRRWLWWENVHRWHLVFWESSHRRSTSLWFCTLFLNSWTFDLFEYIIFELLNSCFIELYMFK